MSRVEEKADEPMIVRAMDKGKFVRVNDSFKAKVGFDATELAEKPFLDWIAPCDRTIVQAALENNERTFFARHITRDGSTLQLDIQVAEHEDGLFILGRCAKVPTQLKSDEVRPTEGTVLGTLEAIARIIEEHNTGFKCSILLVAEGRFVFGAGPSLPEEYNSAVNGYAVGPNIGSCGTAIFWNIPVIVEDIQADPLWAPFAELAKKAGVAACWSHPFVSSGGKVLGALALYSPEPCTPTTEQFSQLKAAARITGLAVERGRAEEKLKRADEATKVARNQLQSTLNALPDLLFEVDSEGRIFSYHTHRNDLLAAPPEVFMGKRFADVLPTDAADANQRAIDEAAQNGFSYGETYRLALPQGEHWFELSVAPLHADAKSDQRFILISRDITERKQADEEVRQLRNYLANIIDSMPSILIGVDADCTVTQWNNAAERATGLTADAILGQPVAHVFPRQSLSMEKVREAIATRTILTALRQGRKEGGETRFEDVTVYPLVTNGLEGAVIRVDDVTDRVRIDEMMIQSEKMLSVGGLAAGMAHEINNPLGGMIQNAIVMGERLANLTLPANIRAAEEAGTSMEAIHTFMVERKILTMIDRIRESGSRASEIVNNMLNFSRISDSSRSSCNIAQLLDQSLELAGADFNLKKTYDFRQIEVVRKYEEKLPVIPCESAKIQQVFLNILRNGAEAMHGHKSQVSRKPRFTLSVAHDSQSATVRIDIEDNGPGMPDETRRRVFEPFFTTKPVGKGTGLGLSVSYFIIAENHKGRMTVESELGKGSIFSIHLPC